MPFPVGEGNRFDGTAWGEARFRANGLRSSPGSWVWFGMVSVERVGCGKTAGWEPTDSF